MIIKSIKKKNDFTIYNAQFFGNFENCFIAQRDKYYAHGETIKQAIEDVNFKFLQKTVNLDNLILEIKKRGDMSISEYRLLTGACSVGVNGFLKEKGIKKTKLSINKVLEITKGHYGGDKIYNLFK